MQTEYCVNTIFFPLCSTIQFLSPEIYFNLVYLFKMCVYQTSGVNIKSQYIYNAKWENNNKNNFIGFWKRLFFMSYFHVLLFNNRYFIFFTAFWRSIENSWVKVIDLLVRKMCAILVMICGSKRVDDVTFIVAKCCLH